MEVLNVDSGEDWTLEFSCGTCAAELRAGAADLEADEFKTSGYHFAGTARSARRLYVRCPICDQLRFLTPDETAEVPYLLAKGATAHRPTRSPEGSERHPGAT